MSKRSYSLITNVALLLGIASALLYNRITHEIAIGIAVVAGILGVGAYFYNSFVSRKSESHEAVNHKIDDDNSLNMVVTRAGSHPAVIELKDVDHIAVDDRVISAMDLYKAERQLSLYLEYMRSLEAKRKETLMHHFWRHHAGRSLRYHLGAENHLMTPEVELSPKETAACAAEIIRDLSGDGKEWDFAFDAKGLRVSRRKTLSNVYAVFDDEEIDIDDEGDFNQRSEDGDWEHSLTH
jgi:hypothetical protein